MKSTKLTSVIGLEIHIELATESKMFCSCSANHFGKKPNSQTCPVCLGLPGSLPVPNKKAVEYAQMIGHALSCKLEKRSRFDRKHYFYPDLPKGFQISQYEKPLCFEGHLTPPNTKKRVRITRVHLEEDTGKLKHKKINSKPSSLVDFNRSGVALVEIVTEPDIRSAKEAVSFAKSLQQLVRYLEVSDCDMEKGSMRLEANISVMKQAKGNKLPDYKVELKNINSFRYMERAIDLEIKRQSVIILSKGKVQQETRGYDEDKNETFTQRVKEQEQDYRYFPEPDIPPMHFKKDHFNKIKKAIPELPDEKYSRFREKYDIPQQYIPILIQDGKFAESVEGLLIKATKKGLKAKRVTNEIVNKGVDVTKIDHGEFIAKLLKSKTAKVDDELKIKEWVDISIKKSPDAVKAYKGGKKSAIAPLIKNVMEISKGRARGDIVKSILEEKLN
jgi:aspartyl-tRNA(Asn)/glutamyl-tRNA(Gln) amidotransferase subunit B